MTDISQIDISFKSEPIVLNDLSNHCVFCKHKGHNYLNCNDERRIYFDSFIDAYEFHYDNKEDGNIFECEMCDKFFVSNKYNKPVIFEVKYNKYVFCKDCFDTLIANTLFNIGEK
jgi:hypothetical protein